MNRVRRHSLTSARGAAIALTAMAGIVVLVEVLWPRPLAFDDPDDDEVRLDGIVLAHAAENAPQTPTIDPAVVTARPLFTVDRKPYSVPEEPPVVRAPPPVVRPPAPTPEIELVLSAVIRAAAAEIALVTVKGKTETHKLKKGDLLEGWTLREVRPDGAVFERNGRQKVVLLHPEKQAPQR